MAAGNSHRTGRPRPLGFTLLELLVVLTIVAMGAAAVSLSMRDSGQTVLEREGVRLAALLESARARSRATGVPVQWTGTASGFQFLGVAPGTLPRTWLDVGTQADIQSGNFGAPPPLQLGPEPLIGPQQVRLRNAVAPGWQARVATDGLRPFATTLEPAVTQ